MIILFSCYNTVINKTKEKHFMYDENHAPVYIEVKDNVLVKYVAYDTIIHIPDGIEVIAEDAFDWSGIPMDKLPLITRSLIEEGGNQYIEKIYIPASVKKIEGGAFFNIIGLEEIIVHPDSPAGIFHDKALFSKDGETLILRVNYDGGMDSGLKPAAYAVPDGVKIIEKNAFFECRLENIILPDTVEEIRDAAFICAHFKHVNIPDSVVKFGVNVFVGADAYDPSKITFSENCPVLKRTDFGIFTKDGTRLIIAFDNFYNGSTGYIIPDGVTHMDDNAIHPYDSRPVTVPKTMREIPPRAFFGSSLDTAYLSDGVTSIGDRAFDYCDALLDIRIPDTLTKIGAMAFRGCSALECIELPESLTEIGENAFEDCNFLVIKAPADSYAIEYAEKHGIEYQELL